MHLTQIGFNSNTSFFYGKNNTLSDIYSHLKLNGTVHPNIKSAHFLSFQSATKYISKTQYYVFLGGFSPEVTSQIHNHLINIQELSKGADFA